MYITNWLVLYSHYCFIHTQHWGWKKHLPWIWRCRECRGRDCSLVPWGSLCVGQLYWTPVVWVNKQHFKRTTYYLLKFYSVITNTPNKCIAKSIKCDCMSCVRVLSHHGSWHFCIDDKATVIVLVGQLLKKASCAPPSDDCYIGVPCSSLITHMPPLFPPAK